MAIDIIDNIVSGKSRNSLFAQDSTDEDNQGLKLQLKSLNDFIGQEKIKRNLSVFIDIARRRNTSLEHILLCGPMGVGKATLSAVIANEMGTTIRKTRGVAINTAKDLGALLTGLRENEILLIEEIHDLKLSEELVDIFCQAMEDNRINIVIGQGPAATSICLELKDFSIIATTNYPDKVYPSIRSKFGIELEFEPYSTDDIIKILIEELKLLKTHNQAVSMTQEGLQEIAIQSQCTIPKAKKIFKQVIEYADYYSDGTLTQAVVIDALKARGQYKSYINIADKKGEIINKIDQCTGVEFEHILKELFIKLGYDVELTKASADQGVDLLLNKNGELIAVQAKCYSSSVGNSSVQEVSAGRMYYKTDKAMVITNNYFTPSAIELAKSTSVILWNRDVLKGVFELVYAKSSHPNVIKQLTL